MVITRDNGYLAVNMEKMIPLLIEAIKTLNDKVVDLKQQLNNLLIVICKKIYAKMFQWSLC